MSTALMTSPAHGLQDLIFDDLRLRQQRIAEITEMIHVSFLEFGADTTLSLKFYLHSLLLIVLSAFSDPKWVLSVDVFLLKIQFGKYVGIS